MKVRKIKRKTTDTLNLLEGMNNKYDKLCVTDNLEKWKFR